jgi:hypothetical protein
MKPDREAEASRLRARPLLIWQAILVVVASVASLRLAKGSPGGLLLGAGLMHLSMRLTEMTLRLSLRRERHPLFAGSLFLAKLLLLLGIGAIGLGTTWIEPMSLAVGAATLPLAIVLDTCYVAWANPRAARDEGPSAPTSRATKRWNTR